MTRSASKTIVVFLSFAFFFIFFIPAKAAESRLFFLSGGGVYQYGKTIKVQAALNSGEGKGINAAEGAIKYDPRYFTVKSIATSTSIFNLWVNKPKVDSKKGQIAYSGGTPDPYKATAGSLFTVELLPIKYGKTYLDQATSSSIVLSADGTGRDILREAWRGAYIIGTSKDVYNNSLFIKSLSGKILLQVQRNGEAWYVYPNDQRRYFLGRPADAFLVMRKLGLGATHKYIFSYKVYPKEVSGKILLDVEKNGEAYYINPVDRKGYYLGRPADAFRIMREKGLGITNDNLDKIPNWAI